MAVAVGQRCVVRIQITDINLRNAMEIMATIVSPQGDEKCQNISFDEVSGLVYATVDVNSAGNWYMWLCVRFANEVFYTPSFVFAEVEGEATPCDAPYIVDVEVQGESVSVTPPKIDVDAVTREEFERLSKDVAGKVDKVEGKGLSTNDFTNEYKQKVDEAFERQDTDNNYTDADKALVQTIPNLATKNEVNTVQKSTTEAIKGVRKELEAKADTDGYYPSMSVGMADKVKGVNKVQEELTLTTKPNGNIVIGNLAGQTKEFMPATPSGDPMHYVYLSYYGVSYNEETNRYTVGYLTDLTADDMRKSFAMYGGGVMSAAYNSWVHSWSDSEVIKKQLPRTTLPVFSTGSRIFYDSVHLNFCWNMLEQISLFYVPPTPNEYNCFKLWRQDISTELLLVLSGMTKLKYIVDPLWCNRSHTLNTFKSLEALREIRLLNLQGNVSFAGSPLLSKESLFYMIDNCASNATFTITLHPNVYAKCIWEGGEESPRGEWNDEVSTALANAESKGTNITLASA